MSIRNHEAGMRRSDTFHLSRYSEPGRGWGTLTVAVDGRTYRAIVPSSLFKYCHGNAARHHPAEIRKVDWWE